ncbi:hypothetical protein Hdeb2414_s0002g00054791 [Helianthus debilis subsp. tardiflorus]
MDSKAMLANITALGVLAFTLVVNVCIQIQTGVVSRGHSTIIVDTRDIEMVYFEIHGIVLEGGYPDPLEVLFGVSYPTIAGIYVTMLLVLLIIHVSSSLAILKSKQIIELKYQKAHEAASTYIQQLNGEMLTVEKLEPYVENNWIMAGSGSPQFIIACSATTTASGVICALTTILHIFTVGWSISEYTFNDCGSAYGKSTQLILIVQFIGVLLGTVAPLSRCFASLSFKVSIESIRNHTKFFRFLNQPGDMLHTASRSEGTADTKDDDFLAGGERVNGDLLHLIFLVEVCKSSVKNVVTNFDRSHFQI